MDSHAFLSKVLPKPKKGFVLYRHKYTGPFNPLQKQLDANDNPLPGNLPYNNVDRISMRHDICYRDNNDRKGKHKCDEIMLRDLKILKPKDFREKIDKNLVYQIISAKRKLGLGLTWSDNLAEELHKPVKRSFKRRKVYANGVDEIWAMDLIDMQSLSKANNGFKYVLMSIGVFSKFGWAVPLKSKSGVEVENALNKLFQKHKPEKIWSDKGSELYNRRVQAFLKKKKILLYSTENEQKSCVVERWKRTVKRIIFKYFTANNTRKYVDVLPKIIDKYNNTYHRTIRCTPVEARKAINLHKLMKLLHSDEQVKVKEPPRFEVGQHVRIVKKKGTFEKSYTTNFTEEVFIVSAVQPTIPITYKIKDLKGLEIKGTFYGQELQRTDQNVFRIEKVLKRRKRGGKKELFVKWIGYSNDYNSWVPEKDLQK